MMNAEEKIIEFLMTVKEANREQVRQATGITSATVYNALYHLVRKGDVTVRQESNGRVPVNYWSYVETEADFTPNLKYAGPSYTHFLQSLWKDQINAEQDTTEEDTTEEDLLVIR